MLEKLYPKKFGTRAVIARGVRYQLNLKFDLSRSLATNSRPCSTVEKGIRLIGALPSFADRPRHRRKTAWPVSSTAWSRVEPISYTHNWRGAIYEHLEAVARGQIHQPACSGPAGCGKTLTVSVFWPAWVWTFAPETKFIFASYAQSLSDKVQSRCSETWSGEDDWYQSLYSDTVGIGSTASSKCGFENTKKVSGSRRRWAAR